jgi:hypothetical protein
VKCNFAFTLDLLSEIQRLELSCLHPQPDQQPRDRQKICLIFVFKGDIYCRPEGWISVKELFLLLGRRSIPGPGCVPFDDAAVCALEVRKGGRLTRPVATGAASRSVLEPYLCWAPPSLVKGSLSWSSRQRGAALHPVSSALALARPRLRFRNPLQGSPAELRLYLPSPPLLGCGNAASHATLD